MNHLSDLQLNEYLDDRISAEDRYALDEHLEMCESCRIRLKEFQFVFDRLAVLPEARLSHDLAPGILSRIPRRDRLLTPAFAVQVSLVAGMLLWLSSQAVRMINLPFVSPNIFNQVKGFHPPQLTFSGFNGFISTFNLRPVSLNFLVTLPKFQFSLPCLTQDVVHISLLHTQYWIDRLPAWQVPPSNIPSFLFIGLILLLWTFSNVVLLRRHSEAKE
jgi:hypothetical protein